MASKPVKVLVASVACCGPVLLVGLGIATGTQDTPSTSAPSAQMIVSAAADAGAAQPSQPRSQPAATVPTNPTRIPGWPFERMGRPVDGTRPPTEEEWREVAALFSDISPVRWHVYEQVMVKPGRRVRARRYLFARYLELRELQKTNPGMYAAKLQQVTFEDEIFRLDTAIRAAPSAPEADKIRAELRDKVMERVDKDLDDREQRLRQLQERLDREKAVLDQDRRRSDQIVENRSNNLRRLANIFRNWAAGKNADGSTPATNNPQNRNNRNDPGTSQGNEKSNSFDD